MATYFYDVVFALEGTIDNSDTPPSTEIPVWVAPRQTTFAANFGGSVGGDIINPTSTATFNVNKNGVSIGTAVLSTLGVASFTTSGGVPVVYNTGDRFTVTSPSGSDATLSGATFVFVGTITF